MTWTGTPDETALHYFTITELRGFERAFENETKYTTAKLETARARAEEFLEKTCNVAFLPRSATETVYGNGTSSVMLSRMQIRSVSAVSINGTAMSAPDVAALVVRPWGQVTRSVSWDADAVIAITYLHGYDAPPEPVKQAAMILAREYALPATMPSRATSQTIGDQTFRVTIAGRDGKTGIPDVDSVIAEYAFLKPVVG